MGGRIAFLTLEIIGIPKGGRVRGICEWNIKKIKIEERFLKLKKKKEGT